MRRGTILYFIRHGETDWNATGRYQGQMDIPLNTRGRSQAARNGRVLKELLADPASLDYVSSPLGRARETMEIVRRELALPPERYRLEDRLKEVHYGSWEGELSEDLLFIDAEGMEARSADPFNWQPRGGESYAQLAARVSPWLSEITRDTVVTSHGGVSRVVRGALLGLDPQRVPRLEVPQDRILMLRDAEQQWL